MEKDLFKKLIINFINGERYVEKLNKLNFEIFDTPLFDSYYLFIDELFKSYFTKDGCDIINWWLYERFFLTNISDYYDSNGNLIEEFKENLDKFYDENSNIIPIESIDDFWEFIKDFRK